MPHTIDFDSIETRLFALHHLAVGSEAVCERFLISRQHEESTEYSWYEYLGNLKQIVSATVIDAAVKIRMLQDLAKHSDDGMDLNAMERAAVDGLAIAVAIPSGKAISLRESCNKIIHATEARLRWLEKPCTNCTNLSCEYWSGHYHLSGTETSGRAWEVHLNVPDWCTAMTRFNRDFQMQVDWSSLAKWDE